MFSARPFFFADAVSDTKAAIFGRLMAVAKVAAGGAITAEAEKMKAKLRHELHKVRDKSGGHGCGEGC